MTRLEARSIYILREALHAFDPMAVSWSLGKDSNVMIWLAKKAFLGGVPCPTIHRDTGLEFPEAYAFRDRYAKEWGLDFRAIPCPAIENVDPTLPLRARLAGRKSLGVATAVSANGFAGLVTGIRRDEEPARHADRGGHEQFGSRQSLELQGFRCLSVEQGR